MYGVILSYTLSPHVPVHVCHVETYLDAHGNIPLLVLGGGLEFVGFEWSPEKRKPSLSIV